MRLPIKSQESYSIQKESPLSMRVIHNKPSITRAFILSFQSTSKIIEKTIFVEQLMAIFLDNFVLS